MHPRLEEVLNYLDSERTKLFEAVELVPAELRDQPPGPDRWSVAQVLQHLVIIEKRIGMGMTKWVGDAVAGGLGPELETSSVLNSLDLALIADRSRRRNAPEEVRPDGSLNAASAWAALGHFYYYDSALRDGGEAARLHAKAALRRAVALDPDRIEAASDLINMESEEGELNKAYDDITTLLHQRPDSGAVHLVHSYVLWYAGLLEEAASECEKTRSLDAGTTDLASCGYVFMALDKYDRAREYFQLVSGTEYEKEGRVELYIREGKEDEALQDLKSLPATAPYGRPLLEPCLQRRSPAEGGLAAQQVRSELMANHDPGPKYVLAAWDSFCGQPEFAFRELRRAIEQNYCAYPQMETDPLLTEIRAMPEFAEVRSLGISCQKHFLEHRRQRSSE